MFATRSDKGYRPALDGIERKTLMSPVVTRTGQLICSSQGIDTSGNNPCGKFQLDVLKAVCEYERNLIRDRVNIGLAAAREKGVKLGRPSRPHKRAGEVQALKKQGMGLRAIGRQLNMPVSTVHAILNRK